MWISINKSEQIEGKTIITNHAVDEWIISIFSTFRQNSDVGCQLLA